MKNYCYFILIISGVLFLSSTLCFSQDEKADYYEFSNKFVFTSTVLQPEFPVKFREIRIVMRDEATKPRVYWTIENKSDKPIRGYAVAFRVFHSIQGWISFGPIVGLGERHVGDIPLILPGKSYTNASITPKPMPLSMEQKIFANPKEDAWFRGIVCIGIIKEVEFMDGTKIQADKPLFDDF
jgi:hypothetical protein